MIRQPAKFTADQERGAIAMNWMTRLYVKANEFHKGQTMTEYALILAAVAVVVVIGYQTMGTDIQNLLTSIDGQL